MWDYTDKVKDHFLHPRNVGKMDAPDAVGEVGSLACGDALRLFLRIEEDRIVDAKFQTFGCGSAIASSSALTEMVRGKTLDEALQVTNKDIAEYLGGLPKEKMHCSVMGREALEAAIANYKGEPLPMEKQDIVCHCFEVTREKIRQVVLENRLTTVEEVTDFTKAGGGCGACVPDIEKLLSSLWETRPVQVELPRPKRLTNLQKIALIQDVIEKEIRPRLQADGGDLELVDVDGPRVVVALRAMCASCHMADVTVSGIQEKLRELVSEDIVVESA